jgi:hypothetical protein
VAERVSECSHAPLQPPSMEKVPLLLESKWRDRGGDGLATNQAMRRRVYLDD